AQGVVGFSILGIDGDGSPEQFDRGLLPAALDGDYCKIVEGGDVIGVGAEGRFVELSSFAETTCGVKRERPPIVVFAVKDIQRHSKLRGLFSMLKPITMVSRVHRNPRCKGLTCLKLRSFIRPPSATRFYCCR